MTMADFIIWIYHPYPGEEFAIFLKSLGPLHLLIKYVIGYLPTPFMGFHHAG